MTCQCRGLHREHHVPPSGPPAPTWSQCWRDPQMHGSSAPGVAFLSPFRGRTAIVAPGWDLSRYVLTSSSFRVRSGVWGVPGRRGGARGLSPLPRGPCMAAGDSQSMTASSRGRHRAVFTRVIRHTLTVNRFNTSLSYVCISVCMVLGTYIGN